METTKNKNSYVFYRSFSETLSFIDDKLDKLALFEAINEYSLNQTEPQFEKKYLFAIWQQIKTAIDSAHKKYSTSIENGKKGGRPKNNSQPVQEVKKAPLSETVVNKAESKQDKFAPQPTIIEKTEPIINQLPIVPVIEEELDEEALNNNQQLRLNDEASFSLKYETYQSNVDKQKFQNGFEFIKNKINCDDKTAIQIYELHEKTTRSIGKLIEEYNLNLAKTI
jgi:hypothetical protein